MYTLTNVRRPTARIPHRAGPVRVTLQISDREFVAVQGQTGGGKSTLLQLLGALDTPTSGSVLLGDEDLSRLGNARLGQSVPARSGSSSRASTSSPP